LAVVLIPYAMSYRSTVEGRILKEVRCELCGLEYVYVLICQAEGQGTSMLFLDNEGAQARARQGAEEQLRANLAGGCAVVPCPECGHVQEHMVPQARRLHRAWMKKVAVGAFIVAGISFLPAMIFTMLADRPIEGFAARALLWPLVGVCLAIAVGLPLLRIVLSRMYDPNNEPVESRKEAAQKVEVRKEDIMKAAQEGTG
jgi:hypothetical protein